MHTTDADLALDPAAQALLFTEARSANSFGDEPVDDATLRAVWELTRWAPTQMNANPLRVLYVRTEQGRERLLPHLSEGNRTKTASAPVSAVLAADVDFHEFMPRLFAHKPGVRDAMAENPQRETVARNNAWLQAGYFILGVRAAGLVAGPMAGFDPAGVDAEFFAESAWRSIMVVNVGHPGENPWLDRLPRLDYDETVRLI